MKYKKGDKFILEIEMVLEELEHPYYTNIGAYLNDEGIEQAEKYEPSAMTAEDAWEMARRIIACTKEYEDALPLDDLLGIFGTHSKSRILCENTVSEACAKIKAFENEQKTIRVGDIVKQECRTGIVMAVQKNKAYVIWEGGWQSFLFFEQIEKTGKKIDIGKFVDQILEK